MIPDPQWPPDYSHLLIRRIERLQHIKRDPMALAILKEHYGKFEAQSCIDFINHWCITFDPRAVKPRLKLMPFILFPRQEEFVHFIFECLRDKEHGLVEKCRDMGATWLCCAISVWLFLFHSGSTVGWGSLLAQNIDDRGNPKAIFLKIRQLFENIPKEMLPKGFNQREHMPLMKILHPTDTATIIGEGGDNVGRGGRTTIYFKDESAHYEHPEMIEAALGDNTDVQIDISSVNGSANVFYRRRQAGEVWIKGQISTPGKVRVFIFDWRDNPQKTVEWYNRRKQKAQDEGLLHIFAQEVDRDYAGSILGTIIHPDWIRASFNAHIKLGFDDSGYRVAGQDVADGGGDKNALAIVHGVVLRYLNHWGGEAGPAARAAIPICAEYRIDELGYDSVGVGVGFKTELNTMREEGGFPNFRIVPWNGGDTVLDPDEHIIPGDPETKTNAEQYYNFKAQAYWRLRNRFYKTYQAVTFGKDYDPSELISIDESLEMRHQLLMELTQIVSKQAAKGKTVIDKKPNGAVSPNLADCVNMAYSPRRELSILDVL